MLCHSDTGPFVVHRAVAALALESTCTALLIVDAPPLMASILYHACPHGLMASCPLVLWSSRPLLLLTLCGIPLTPFSLPAFVPIPKAVVPGFSCHLPYRTHLL